jgi:hypothetical protein
VENPRESIYFTLSNILKEIYHLYHPLVVSSQLRVANAISVLKSHCVTAERQFTSIASHAPAAWTNVDSERMHIRMQARCPRQHMKLNAHYTCMHLSLTRRLDHIWTYRTPTCLFVSTLGVLPEIHTRGS